MGGGASSKMYGAGLRKSRQQQARDFAIFTRLGQEAERVLLGTEAA